MNHLQESINGAVHLWMHKSSLVLSEVFRDTFSLYWGLHSSWLFHFVCNYKTANTKKHGDPLASLIMKSSFLPGTKWVSFRILTSEHSAADCTVFREVSKRQYILQEVLCDFNSFTEFLNSWEVSAGSDLRFCRFCDSVVVVLFRPEEVWLCSGVFNPMSLFKGNI